MIGAERYFPNRYFAPRYWPKAGAASNVAFEPPTAIFETGLHTNILKSGTQTTVLQSDLQTNVLKGKR